MIVVRNIFRLKFGQSKDVTAHWKQAMALIDESKLVSPGGMRLLTDVAGPDFYTIVFETTHRSLGDFEEFGKKVREISEWGSVYSKITALTESGRREILSVIE